VLIRTSGLPDYADLPVNREEALRIWPEPGRSAGWDRQLYLYPRFTGDGRPIHFPIFHLGTRKQAGDDNAGAYLPSIVSRRLPSY
jgi:hypothetical protein